MVISILELLSIINYKAKVSLCWLMVMLTMVNLSTINVIREELINGLQEMFTKVTGFAMLAMGMVFIIGKMVICTMDLGEMI